MKGLLLAGGQAQRLRPLTIVTNKHLLPVYELPMIAYPLATMEKAGVYDITVVTNPEHVGAFVNLLPKLASPMTKLHYIVQENPGGLAEPIKLVASHFRGNKMMMMLGDNIVTDNLSNRVRHFDSWGKGAVIFAKQVEHPEHYGVIEFGPDGGVEQVVEKPTTPVTDYAQTGIYLYDESVYDRVEEIDRSDRGELEITDLNNLYAETGLLESWTLKGYWIDAGTSYDELLAANNAVAELRRKGEL